MWDLPGRAPYENVLRTTREGLRRTKNVENSGTQVKSRMEWKVALLSGACSVHRDGIERNQCSTLNYPSGWPRRCKCSPNYRSFIRPWGTLNLQSFNPDCIAGSTRLPYSLAFLIGMAHIPPHHRPPAIEDHTHAFSAAPSRPPCSSSCVLSASSRFCTFCTSRTQSVFKPIHTPTAEP